MAASDMGDFWDRRARENAYFFVDNRLDYGSPDMEQFWAGGETDVDGLLDAVAVRIAPTDAVVEIGCGVGRLTRVIAARADCVFALDVSAEMLALAREHNPALDNVSWLHGDGTSLAGIPAAGATACLSHVVFQHIPDPEITLGYIRDMGRVLRPGGWAAFQVSNDPSLHRPRRGARLRGVLPGGGPKGQDQPEWLGSAVALDDLRAAAGDGEMDVERVVGEGTQFCVVLTRKRDPRE